MTTPIEVYMPTLTEAAQARREATRSRNDRPSQRRHSEVPSTGRPYVRASLNHVQLRLTGPDVNTLTFTGYASVTDSPYTMYDCWGPFTEVVNKGAFEETLAANPDVPLTLQHDPLRRLARTTNDTLQLAEDDQGLAVTAQLDPADADVAYIVPKLRSGLIDEMSFAFTITAGMWSPDYDQFNIVSADINRGDVSIVGYGANPATSVDLRTSSVEALLAKASVEDVTRYQRLASDRLRELQPASRGMSLAQALRLP